VEYWRNFNQCSETAIFEEYPDLVNDGLTFEMYSYLDGTNDSRVGFIKVNNGLHRWYLGGNNDIDYTEEIAKFFTGTIDVTDIAEQNESSLNLYPNPATDFIFVETQNAVHIFDLCGKLVLQGCGRIDVSSLPEGMYFVKSEKGFTKLVINR
jgi:hypothetical protein